MNRRTPSFECVECMVRERVLLCQRRPAERGSAERRECGNAGCRPGSTGCSERKSRRGGSRDLMKAMLEVYFWIVSENACQ